MPTKDILIIHPMDLSTVFLGKIAHYIKNKFPERTHIFKVHPNDDSHNDCIKAIESHPETGIIIFLGHGRSDGLIGAKGKLYNNRDFVSEDAKAESPENYYFNPDFIKENNYHIFSGKKIISISCRSKELGPKLIAAGARCFVGFGPLPSSCQELEDLHIPPTELLVASIKGEINYIMKKSLVYAISNHYKFYSFRDLIRFITAQRLASNLHTNYRMRYDLSTCLYNLRHEVEVLGNSHLYLIG